MQEQRTGNARCRDIAMNTEYLHVVAKEEPMLAVKSR
jgi:hypothetical protein